MGKGSWEGHEAEEFNIGRSSKQETVAKSVWEPVTSNQYISADEFNSVKYRKNFVKILYLQYSVYIYYKCLVFTVITIVIYHT